MYLYQINQLYYNCITTVQINLKNSSKHKFNLSY